jgi:acetylornithine deacetylase/succinyl-diaminopimelate desuccinylase-like protein
MEQLRPLVDLEEVLRVPHVRLKTWTNSPVETAVFPFTTDIPLLSAWGTPLLFGPGSFLMAHTSQEYLDLAELEAAIGHYVALATSCLRDAAAPATS